MSQAMGPPYWCLSWQMYFKMESHDKQWYNLNFLNQITLQDRTVMPCIAHFWLPFIPEQWKNMVGQCSSEQQVLSEHFTAFIAWTKPANLLKWKQNRINKWNFLFWSYLPPIQQIPATFAIPILSPTAKKGTLVENKPLICQPREAEGSPEKAGQCCHFQSDWHWAVSLHSTVHDSALVANTGSSVTAAVQSKIAWKHEWMIDLIHKKSDAKSDWCLPVYSSDMRDGWIHWLTDETWWDRQIGCLTNNLEADNIFHSTEKSHQLMWMTSDWQLV